MESGLVDLRQRRQFASSVRIEWLSPLVILIKARAAVYSSGGSRPKQRLERARN